MTAEWLQNNQCIFNNKKKDFKKGSNYFKRKWLLSQKLPHNYTHGNQILFIARLSNHDLATTIRDLWLGS